MVPNRVVGKRVRVIGDAMIAHFRGNRDLYTLGSVGFAFGYMLGIRGKAPRNETNIVINMPNDDRTNHTKT